MSPPSIGPYEFISSRCGYLKSDDENFPNASSSQRILDQFLIRGMCPRNRFASSTPFLSRAVSRYPRLRTNREEFRAKLEAMRLGRAIVPCTFRYAVRRIIIIIIITRTSYRDCRYIFGMLWLCIDPSARIFASSRNAAHPSSSRRRLDCNFILVTYSYPALSTLQSTSTTPSAPLYTAALYRTVFA